MFPRIPPISPLALQTAILRNPLTVSPQITVRAALNAMGRTREIGSVSQPSPTPPASCVLVLEENYVLGILTERDIVYLNAQGQDLDSTPMQAVMTTPVITLPEADLTTFGIAEALFQHHGIRHLPIVDNEQRLVGLLTYEGLRSLLYATDLTQTVQMLEQSQRQLMSLVAAVPVGMFRTDALGNCLYVNDRWCQITGITATEALGQGWARTLHPQDRERVTGDWETSVRERRPFQLEYRFQQPDGQIRWVYGQAVAEYNATGTVVGYVGSLTDISDRKTTEHALQVQRDFNRLIAEITSRFVDLDPAHLDAEIDRTLQLLGEATQIDTSYLVRFSPSDSEPLRLEDRTLTMTHEWCRPGWPRQASQLQNLPLDTFPWAITRLLQRQMVHVPDVTTVPPVAAIDQHHWQQFHVRSLLGVPLVQQSRVVAALGFASFSQPMVWDEETIRLLQVMGQAIANVQERIETEQNLYVSEERLRLALSAANQGLYDLNLLTGEAIVNPEYALMLGYDPATFRETNARWIARLHPADQAVVAATYENYVAGKISDYQVEFRQRTRTGDYKWILSLGKIVTWDATGQPLRMLGTHTDITDRKQAEAERLHAEKVHQELKLLESILDIVLAGYWDWDLVNQREYLSPGLKRMFGYAAHELPNTPQSWQDLIFPEDLPGVLACFEKHIQSQGRIPYYNEVRYRHKNGSTVWVICSGQVIEWDAMGQPLRMIGCHIDITQRKEAEATLQQTKEELEAFFQVALDLLCIADLDGHFRRVNRSWELILGYSVEDLEGISFLDLIHPDDLESTQSAIATLGHQETVHAFVNRYRCKDGTYRYIEWYSRPRGHLIYAAARDITEQQLVEQRLRQNEAHLKAAQRIGKIGSWEFDVATGQISWSDEVFRIFGWDPAAGPPSYAELQQLYPPEDQIYHDQTVQQALAQGQPYDLECRVCRPDGSLVYIQVRGEPIVDASRQVVQLVGTVLDITERKLAEAKLLQTTAQLVASNRELEAFAYSVSHDLRAPLRAIAGFSNALLEDYGDSFDDEARDYFDRIRNNVNRMGLLIDDLLRLSRVSRAEMQYAPVNLTALAQEIIHDLQSTEPTRQVEWVVVPGAIVTADATLMRVTLANLLQNAWKFTSHHPTARIEFGVTQHQGHPTYFVQDDGAGFDMAYSDKLFGVFQRLHDTHEFPGTGIGLATVQRAIHRHGGLVWAEGRIEQGATFYFTLPHHDTSPFEASL